MKFNKRGYIACVLFLIVFAIIFWMRNGRSAEYRFNEGLIFGTVYHITYQYSNDLQEEIEDELHRFNASLSPFDPTSIISRINRNDTGVVADKWFTVVFNRSKEIYEDTGGAFDPTLSPLINAWGFGYDKKDSVTPVIIDSLRQFVGMKKISLQGDRVIKSDPRMTLNFSAIAKGYACDVIAEMLSKKGIRNYLVEIGGEIVAKGINPHGECWKVGINKPEDDGGYGEVQQVVAMSDGAMATSGNYRNYKIVNGKRIAHTIDPVSGYPVQHSLLSATVFAPDCMTADAYATAFMVLGLEKSMLLAEQNKDIEAFFIYATGVDSTALAVESTPGMAKYIVK
ncbi:FAD:protein FMN transferase [Coprobacter sp. LH1063]|uniref:FAD:protein FMN transferase n=2 Tax=Coprobacter tertius TaxID=2944915 RepID=A0ABT1MJV6_9BACT|nr:FAD:protein FMN transferase [Coprobacter tertius]